MAAEADPFRRLLMETLVVPALLVVVGAQLAYWMGNYSTAFLLPLAIGIGVYSLSRYRTTSNFKKVIFLGISIPLLVLFLLWLALMMACLNGDCI